MVDKEIEEKYSEVLFALEESIEKAESIVIAGDEENTELSEIRKTLKSLNNDFKSEIDKLEKSSEWYKLCIAFISETNAGKSTLIDTLRIIYDEETRRADALAQKDDYITALRKHCTDYQNLINSLQNVNIELETYQEDAAFIPASSHESDIAFESQSKKHKWIYYIITVMVGIVIGFLLANTVIAA